MFSLGRGGCIIYISFTEHNWRLKFSMQISDTCKLEVSGEKLIL